MKLHYFLVLIVFGLLQPTFAQTLPNASFDSVYIGALNRVYHWVTSDGFLINSGYNGDTAYALAPNSSYSPASELVFNLDIEMPAHHSSAAVVLTNETDFLRQDGNPFPTFITNGTTIVTGPDGYPEFIGGGSPLQNRPKQLNFYYKLINDDAVIDFCGEVMVMFKRYNTVALKIDTVGFAQQLIPCSASGSPWSPIQVPITYRSLSLPDSVIVVFSLFPASESGGKSRFYIDELEFSTPTGSDEFAATSNKLPYPNPTTNLLYLPEELRYLPYRITNALGQVQREGNGWTTNAMGQLPEGLYQLTVFPKNDEPINYSITKKNQ